MNLVYYEINSPEAWEKGQGEMNALVAAQAKESGITIEEMYQYILDALRVPFMQVALLVNTDVGMPCGFVIWSAIGKQLVVNWLSKSKKVRKSDYQPVLKEYINNRARSVGATNILYMIRHAIKHSIKQGDKVSKFMEGFDAHPIFIAYQSTVTEGGENNGN